MKQKTPLFTDAQKIILGYLGVAHLITSGGVVFTLDTDFNPPRTDILKTIIGTEPKELKLVSTSHSGLTPLFEVAFGQSAEDKEGSSEKKYATFLFAKSEEEEVFCEVTTFWEGTPGMGDGDFVDEWTSIFSLVVLGKHKDDDLVLSMLSGDSTARVFPAEVIFELLHLWLEKAKAVEGLIE